jgi:hypothetical protein
MVALLTDEAMRAPGLYPYNQSVGGVDERVFLDGMGSLIPVSGRAYQDYHNVRVTLRQAREAIQRFAPRVPSAVRGRLAAMEGNVILWFAELFCSGIPLTAVPIEGDPIVTDGYSTQELFEYAVALFDTALAISSDSSTVTHFASVGKGRALLGLGRLAEAASAVRDVPTDFVAKAYFLKEGTIGGGYNVIGANPQSYKIVNGEGGTSLSWSTDSRAAIVTTPALSGDMQIPAKYSKTAEGSLDATIPITDNPIRVADGLEARLIEAEAALAAGREEWLTILNHLRATCVGSSVCAPVPGLSTAQLPPISDPGTPTERLDTLMKERAMWLYLTGHRQGDLRRLVRIYHRPAAALWPSGTYWNPPIPPRIYSPPAHNSLYGTDFVFLPSPDEARLNLKYRGCNSLEP